VYRFANGDGEGQPVRLIGSADLMPRNLDRRVEALVPVDDPALGAQLDEILEVNLADDVLAWTLDDQGRWSRLRGDAVDTHLRMQEIARTRVRRRT
jgi:polyphosphate kinase